MFLKRVLFLALCLFFVACTPKQPQIPEGISVTGVTHGTIIYIEVVDSASPLAKELAQNAGETIVTSLIDTTVDLFGFKGLGGKVSEVILNSEDEILNATADAIDRSTEMLLLEIRIDETDRIVTLFTRDDPRFQEGSEVMITVIDNEVIVKPK